MFAFQPFKRQKQRKYDKLAYSLCCQTLEKSLIFELDCEI